MYGLTRISRTFCHNPLKLFIDRLSALRLASLLHSVPAFDSSPPLSAALDEAEPISLPLLSDVVKHLQTNKLSLWQQPVSPLQRTFCHLMATDSYNVKLQPYDLLSSVFVRVLASQGLRSVWCLHGFHAYLPIQLQFSVAAAAGVRKRGS